MSVEKDVSIVLTARDNTAAGMASAAQNVKKFASQTQAASGGGILKDLKGMFGEGSEFGLGAKTLMGGGAIMGLHYAAKGLDELSEKVLTTANAVRAGTMTIGEAIGGMVTSIPVVGDLSSAIANIALAFTGEAAAVERSKQAHDTFIAALRIELDLEKQLALLRLPPELRGLGKQGQGYMDTAAKLDDLERKATQQRDAALKAAPQRRYWGERKPGDTMRSTYLAPDEEAVRKAWNKYEDAMRSIRESRKKLAEEDLIERREEWDKLATAEEAAQKAEQDRLEAGFKARQKLIDDAEKIRLAGLQQAWEIERDRAQNNRDVEEQRAKEWWAARNRYLAEQERKAAEERHRISRQRSEESDLYRVSALKALDAREERRTKAANAGGPGSVEAIAVGGRYTGAARLAENATENKRQQTLEEIRQESKRTREQVELIANSIKEFGITTLGV